MGHRIFRVDVVRSPVLWRALRRTLPRSCQLTATPAFRNFADVEGNAARLAHSPHGLGDMSASQAIAHQIGTRAVD